MQNVENKDNQYWSLTDEELKAVTLRRTDNTGTGYTGRLLRITELQIPQILLNTNRRNTKYLKTLRDLKKIKARVRNLVY